MVFGTFDFLHKGHLYFFSQAKKLAQKSFLIVSVARDVNVKKIKKHKAAQGEALRLAKIQSLKIVDKAVLGGKSGYLNHILRERPNIIALGYDQKAYVQNLKRDIEKHRLKIKIRRLKAFMPRVYKSSVIKLKKSMV